MKSFIIVLLAGMLAMGCQKEEPANIRDLNQQFIGAWNSKDADKIITFLADDVQFVQGSAHYTGKNEVSTKWVKETLPTLRDLKTNVVSSGADATMAYEAGTFSVDVLPERNNEPEGIGEGNFMLLWKKGQDKQWKLSYAQLEDLPVRVKQ